MKKIFTLVLTLFFFVGFMALTQAAPKYSIDFSGKKIASLSIVPYINISNDETDYVLDSLKEGYTNYFSKEGFKTIAKEETATALINAGYSEEDNIIASDETLKSVSQSVNADFVIAMEVEEIETSRSDDFPNTKLTARIKLLYKIYKKSEDKVYNFRIATARDNKATLAEVGPKFAVKNALNQALERGNHRLIEIINGSKNNS